MPGDIIKSPGQILAPKTKMVTGEIYKVNEFNEETRRYLKDLGVKRQFDYVAAVTQALATKEPVEPKEEPVVVQEPKVEAQVKPATVTPVVKPTAKVVTPKVTLK